MTVLGRQLAFLVVVGCAVSLAAEGRVVPWLVLDAVVGAAFIPVIQVVGFSLVWRLRMRRGAPSTETALAFLDGNTPWLWWFFAIAAVTAFVPPRSLGPFGIVIWPAAGLLFITTFVSDMRWLRDAHIRSSRDAAIDVMALRVVIWGAGLVWFFGIAVWYGEVPKVLAWFGA